MTDLPPEDAFVQIRDSMLPLNVHYWEHPDEAEICSRILKLFNLGGELIHDEGLKVKHGNNPPHRPAVIDKTGRILSIGIAALVELLVKNRFDLGIY